MAILRRNPFLPSTYREWFPRGLTFRNLIEFPEFITGRYLPSMDVYSDEEDLVVKMDLPEFTSGDVDVSVDGASLTISGKHEHEEKVEEENYFRKERYAGSFTRTVSLPHEVKEEDIAANLKDGILEVRVKGAGANAAVEGKKKIPIASV